MGAIAEPEPYSEHTERSRNEGSGRISLSEIFCQEREHVARFVRARLRRESGVEDLVQEVFLTAHRRLDTYDPRRPARPWLTGIARRVISDHLRRAHVRREHPTDLLPSAVVEEASQTQAILRKQGRAMLRRAIRELRPEQREVYVAHELEGQPIKDFAEEAQIPLQTAYARLSAARRAMERDMRRRTLGERLAQIALVLLPSWLFGKSSAAALATALVAAGLVAGAAAGVAFLAGRSGEEPGAPGAHASLAEASASRSPQPSSARAASTEPPPGASVWPGRSEEAQRPSGAPAPSPSAPARARPRSLALRAGSPAPPASPVPPSAPFAAAEPAAVLAAEATPSSPPSLTAEELSLLASARRAVAGTPELALRRANLHRERYPHGLLEQERERLAIEALGRLGRGAEAHARASSFRQRFPSSAHLGRIEEILTHLDPARPAVPAEGGGSAPEEEAEEEGEAPLVGL